MKITKKQLKRIIKEEKAKILKEMHPRAEADNAYMDVLEAVAELVNLGVKPTFVETPNDDEVYIMTGADEGITVKVLRRGR